MGARGRRKSDVETRGVHMRLPVDVIERLDELAMSTHGSRGTVVMDLVSRAEVRQIEAPMAYMVVRLPDDAREVSADEQC